MENINEYLRDNLKKIGGKLDIAPEIPVKKIDNVVKEFGYKDSINKIVAVLDNTVFGSAKEGIVFVGSGFFVKDGSRVSKVEFSNIFKASITQDESIIINLKNDNTLSLPKIIDSSFSSQNFVNLINEVIEKFDSFEDAEQSVALEAMTEELKIAYINIIVKMTFENDGHIDDKEVAELLLLMTRLRLTSESRFVVRQSIANPNEILDVSEYLDIIDAQAPIGQRRNLHISLYKDMVNIHSSAIGDFDDDFDFINKNLPLLEVTEDDRRVIKQAIQNDRAILNDDITDSKIIDNMKNLAMNAASVGTPIAAIYISGSVMGLSAAGITSGLATLGMGGLLGMSGMVTGIGIVVLLGVGTYQGLKKMTGANEISLYEKRRLMLNEIIKQNQEAVSLLMNDINEIVLRLTKAIRQNAESSNQTIKLATLLQTMTRGGKQLDNRENMVQSKIYATHCPRILNVKKLDSLTTLASLYEYKTFILEHYEPKIVKKKVKTEDDSEKFEKVEVLALKKNLEANVTERLKNAFEAIGYFSASNVLSAGTRSASDKFKNAFKGLGSAGDKKPESDEQNGSNDNEYSSAHDIKASTREETVKDSSDTVEDQDVVNTSKEKLQESTDKAKQVADKAKSRFKGLFK